MSAPSSPPVKNSTPHAPAWLGIILFLIGLGMIYYVFHVANGLLSAPAPAVPKVVGTDPNGATNAGLALGADIKELLKKLLLLLVMCVAGAVFSSHGIKMAFAAWNSPRREDHIPPTP